MCGIAAIYSNAVHSQHDARERTVAMTNIMAHRGPDADGIFMDDRIALGHRRLSIIDLSAAGAQPMHSRNERYVIIFNGEIYNYRELNAELAAKGFTPKSHSDTETILNLYAAEGERCVEKLRGMFAFILWDKQEKKLFAARDRFGIKPLYYAETSQGVVFASELKGILASGLTEKRLNANALNTLFETGSVMQPETMISGVFNLNAATTLTIESGKMSQRRYWQPAFEQSPVSNGHTSHRLSYGDAKAELRSLFFEALEKHLISDVPLGVFLSGGIDSSLIVAAMQQLGQRTKTFSIGFEAGGNAYNETHHARQVAERYGTAHTELILTETDVLNDLDRIVSGIDQPSADGLNTYAVSKATRPFATVALSGLGADELFAGYTSFKFLEQLRSLQGFTNLVPAFAGNLFSQVESSLPASVQDSWLWKGATGAMGGYRDTAHLYNIRAISGEAQRRRFFSAAFKDLQIQSLDRYRAAVKDIFQMRAGRDQLSEVSLLELKFYMMNTLLRDTDAMSMINSLEVRVPFLDHKLAEFVMRLPSSFKIDRDSKSTGKKILIDAFSDLLPPEIVHRKKMGFVFPLAIWMRTGKFREVIRDTLTEQAVRERGIFDYGKLSKQMHAFWSGSDESPRSYRTYLRLWLATLTELWMQKNL